jgi:hypothetical protein
VGMGVGVRVREAGRGGSGSGEGEPEGEWAGEGEGRRCFRSGFGCGREGSEGALTAGELGGGSLCQSQAAMAAVYDAIAATSRRLSQPSRLPQLPQAAVALLTKISGRRSCFEGAVSQKVGGVGVKDPYGATAATAPLPHGPIARPPGRPDSRRPSHRQLRRQPPTTSLCFALLLLQIPGKAALRASQWEMRARPSRKWALWGVGA